MLKIKKGDAIAMVTSGAFKSIYQSMGWAIAHPSNASKKGRILKSGVSGHGANR